MKIHHAKLIKTHLSKLTEKKMHFKLREETHLKPDLKLLTYEISQDPTIRETASGLPRKGLSIWGLPRICQESIYISSISIRISKNKQMSMAMTSVMMMFRSIHFNP